MEREPRPLREVLAGRYRIEQELGRGGFATVHRVWNLSLARYEALKVLKPGHDADEDFPRRFRQEVRLAAGLDHPSIVTVYDFGESDGVYWYSMRLVEGRTLSAELKVSGALEEREAARIAIPVLDALDYSHARGIVHRDIKPENVIVDHGGHPFLMDFGIAKSAESLVKTQTGFLLGTPSYVAPEQAQGKPTDGRADLYALGVTLYRVVSGRYPFEAQDPLQAVILRLTEPPRPLAEALPGVDPLFAAIVMRALRRNPDERWESAGAMRDAFAAYLESRANEPPARRAGLPDALNGGPIAPDGEAEDATRLGPTPLPTARPPQAAVPTVLSDRRGQRPITSALGAPSRRSYILRLAAGLVLVLCGLGAAGLFLLRERRAVEQSPAGPHAPLPARATASAAPTPAPAALPTEAPTPPPLATPSSGRSPAVLASPGAARPARSPAPEPRAAPRPVTAPERLTPEPPLAGEPPPGCSGVAVTVGFAVDPAGEIVAPRLFPSGAPAECGRFVLEALPRWQWRPALDAGGKPVRSARLVAYVRLP
jgi:serine/threonine-protein kinase